MNIESIFPIAIGINLLDRPFNYLENLIVDNQETKPNVGNVTSVNDKVLDIPEMSELKNFITTNVNHYFDLVYRPKNKLSVYITQSWTNYTNKGMSHHRHNHANSFLSGVLYFKCNEQDKIYFYNDMHAILNRPLNIPAREYNDFNAENRWYTVSPGMLVLFPSYLSHYVETVESDHQRVSLAFNTYIRGEVGSSYSLTQLILK